MSDAENFLTRWARRKRSVADASGEQPDAPAEQSVGQATDAGHTLPLASAGEPSEPLFDLSKLPAVESITAETDVSAFFAPGVPAELQLAALRRAWVVDPRIRDFVGLNDYDFDFHTPGAIPGFGALEMTDELRREVLRIVGNLLPDDKPTPEPPHSRPPADVPPHAQSEVAESKINAQHVPVALTARNASSLLPEVADHSPEELQSKIAVMQREQGLVALQQDVASAKNLQIPARRTHGGALPK